MLDARQDQATGLRRLFARDRLQMLRVRSPGATAVSLELAYALVVLGHRPLIVDLEKGEAAIALGLKARYDLAHVMSGDKSMADVLLMGREGIGVLPAARGLYRAAEQGRWKDALSNLLRDTPQPFNVWLISGGEDFVGEPESPLLVIAPTRSSITGAYATIKSLARNHGQRDFRVVVDRAASESVALSAYESIAETSRRFLSARLDYCGYLPRDDRAAPGKAFAPRQNVTDLPTPRARAFSRLAQAVFAATPTNPQQHALNMGC